MAKRFEMNEVELKEAVCKFYLNNKTDCDSIYLNAEKNIGKIYENIDDINLIHSLFIQTYFVVITANKYEKTYFIIIFSSYTERK